MRGSRGIEFGVDLPALPALGLGEAPHPTSTCDRPVFGPASAQNQAQGDGWGFGDWTRFVGAWKKSKEDEAAAIVGQTSAKNKMKLNDPQTESSDQQERERGEEHGVTKSDVSTDKMSMSVVFDWLVERVPAVGKQSVSAVSTSLSSEDIEVESVNERKKEGVEDANVAARRGAENDKELHRAVEYTVGAGVGLGSTIPSTSPPHGQDPARLSEVKRHINKEDRGVENKRELATRDDLERFYIALARKMYDEGL